jgi:hypothetical protein
MQARMVYNFLWILLELITQSCHFRAVSLIHSKDIERLKGDAKISATLRHATDKERNTGP